MARRRKTYTRTVYRKARSGYRRRKGLLTGNTGNILWGAVGGAISPMIPQFVGKWTNPLVFGGLGYLMKKPAFLTIAGYQMGQALIGGGLSLNGNGNNSLFQGD